MSFRIETVASFETALEAEEYVKHLVEIGMPSDAPLRIYRDENGASTFVDKDTWEEYLADEKKAAEEAKPAE